MKAWWQQLSQREQHLVLAMGSASIIFIFFVMMWQPLNDNIVKAEQKLSKQQVLLNWVNENTERFKNIKRSGSTNRSAGSLSSIINRSANQQKLTITRIQPQGDDIQVWIDEISFTQLLFWLEHLSNNEGLQIKAIDLAVTEQKGVVKVRRLQLGK